MAWLSVFSGGEQVIVAASGDTAGDPERRALTRPLVGFADEIGAVLVAEGIETAAEHDALRRRLTAPGGSARGRPLRTTCT